MDQSSIFQYLIFIAYLCFTIYRANHDQVMGERSGTLLRWLLYGLIALTAFAAVFAFQLATVPSLISADVELPPVDPLWAAVNLGLAVGFALLCLAMILSQPFRQRFRSLLPANATFDPDSPVHVTAWVLMLLMISGVITNFVAGGGISGMAQSIETSGIELSDVAFENTLWILAATLGIGLFLRRTPQAALSRLGVRFPTMQDLTWGTGLGVLLFGLVIAVSIVWVQSVSPEELAQQTAASSQIAQSFNSLSLAFLLALIVSFGEEIFFRGAIQPVFGNVFTTIIFAALHTQYTLTPATILIIATSLALGWLRERYSTSASIIGHFVYNFIQLALAVLFGSAV